MWSRESIKDYAKDFLSKHYWKAFVVCLIIIILGGSSGGSGSQIDLSYDRQVFGNKDILVQSRNLVFNAITRRLGGTPVFYTSIGIISIIAVVFFIIMITVGYALDVGKARFFLRGFKGDVEINNLFSTFNSEEYSNIVLTQFIRGLYNFLWFLVLIIPGIIKSYEYRMVPYILAEEPNLPSDEVIDRSRDMTNGHKWDMFVLDLSFWGWYILGSLLLGIGGIFVKPYVEATYARLYNILSGD